jgi:hypothetical protein
MLMRALLLLSLSFIPLHQLLAADESPTASKVRIAKDLYYADRDKAEAALISALTRRLEAAKKSGDLKTLEALQTELDAFRSAATLPKLVPVRDYETALKVARTKYENVMAAGVKALTQAGSLEEAKALDQQLKDFQASAVAAATAKENAAPAKEVFSWNQFPDPSKIPLKQFQPGLIMYEFAREPEQTDGEKANVDIEKFKDPIGPPQLVKSLNWKYTASRNAIASGYLKIPKDGEYSFKIANFYGRTCLLINNTTVCKYRDGKINKIELKAGLVPIVSVGFVEARGYVDVSWQPPGQEEMGPVPPELLYFHVPKK